MWTSLLAVVVAGDLQAEGPPPIDRLLGDVVEGWGNGLVELHVDQVGRSTGDRAVLQPEEGSLAVLAHVVSPLVPPERAATKVVRSRVVRVLITTCSQRVA